MRHTRFSLLAAFALFMTGCAYKPSFINEYKIDVQQGNVLTQDMVAQLKPGQTREQVRFILGSPLLTDVFHRERCIRLPMRREARSLNLSNSVAILTYEALRQNGFPGLTGTGEMAE